MSRKTELGADLKRIGYQLGGAHLTRQARDATFSTFAKVMREEGYGIHTAAQIGGKHLQAFAAHRAQQGIGARARANELSHLRSVLVQLGKQGLARNPPPIATTHWGSNAAAVSEPSGRCLTTRFERFSSGWNTSVAGDRGNPRIAARTRPARSGDDSGGPD